MHVLCDPRERRQPTKSIALGAAELGALTATLPRTESYRCYLRLRAMQLLFPLLLLARRRLLRSALRSRHLTSPRLTHSTRRILLHDARCKMQAKNPHTRRMRGTVCPPTMHKVAMTDLARRPSLTPSTPSSGRVQRLIRPRRAGPRVASGRGRRACAGMGAIGVGCTGRGGSRGRWGGEG